jgi:hypothetical protein
VADNRRPWIARVIAAAITLAVAAVVSRIAFELLWPLLPFLAVGLFYVVLFELFRRR